MVCGGGIRRGDPLRARIVLDGVNIPRSGSEGG